MKVTELAGWRLGLGTVRCLPSPVTYRLAYAPRLTYDGS